METRQILNILKNTVDTNKFLGVFASDMLPTTETLKNAIIENNGEIGLVLNTDPSTKPGSHWVAIYVNSDGTEADYFDSYGLPPTRVPNISKFLMKNFKKWQYNKKRIQNYFSSVCGHYCIYFIVQRSKNIPMSKIANKFSAENCEQNDEMITEWINENFDMDTETFNIDFIVNQLCQVWKIPPELVPQ